MAWLLQGQPPGPEGCSRHQTGAPHCTWPTAPHATSMLKGRGGIRGWPGQGAYRASRSGARQLQKWKSLPIPQRTASPGDGPGVKSPHSGLNLALGASQTAAKDFETPPSRQGGAAYWGTRTPMGRGLQWSTVGQPQGGPAPSQQPRRGIQNPLAGTAQDKLSENAQCSEKIASFGVSRNPSPLPFSGVAQPPGEGSGHRPSTAAGPPWSAC